MVDTLPSEVRRPKTPCSDAGPITPPKAVGWFSIAHCEIDPRARHHVDSLSVPKTTSTQSYAEVAVALPALLQPGSW
jgi:hypothetical protein